MGAPLRRSTAPPPPYCLPPAPHVAPLRCNLAAAASAARHRQGTSLSPPQQ